MKIKVQIEGGASVQSIVASGVENIDKPQTFIAFSETMKARVLEQFLQSPLKIGLSIFNGESKTGEWHEDFAANAVFNK
jgi:hypothetical protein